MDRNEDLIPEEHVQLPVTEPQPDAPVEPQSELQNATPEVPVPQPEEPAAVATTQEETKHPANDNAKSTADPRKKQRFFQRRILSAVLVLALVISGCAVTAAMVNSHWENRTAELTASMEDQLTQLRKEFSDRVDKIENNGNSVSGSPGAIDGLTPGQVYAQNVASVVLVYSQSQQGYFSGSGFILTEDGYVVTNCHVVEGGKSYTVVTSDNVQHEATLVGSDPSNDVAVLKVDQAKFQAVRLGSSDALIVGDQVAAIGNPLGELTSTLTVGYVSATGRYVTTENTTINMIQTDCAINSGNSGGPLFNMKGEVVAITTAKYSGLSSSGASIEGIGFAIPMDDIVGIIEDLIEFGHVNSGYLGVMVNNQNEIEPGLPDGAHITDVVPGYCAEKAGIKPGDYIVELGGHKIMTMNDLTRILRRMDPGTTTTVKVLRGKKILTLEITLDQRPLEGTPSAPQEQVPLPEEGNYDEWYEYFKWFFENEGTP